MAFPFGFEFEESVFEGGCRERKGRAALIPTYSARICEPQWFYEETNSEEDAESVNVKKFRGDLSYKQQEFKKALCEYSSCLALLPPNNVAMRRDVQESQARCLAHLGKHKEALEIAEILKNGATNTDHATAVLGLQFAIYCMQQHVEKTIGCLQQLILLHPFHPGNWKLLGEAYGTLLQFPALPSVPETGRLQSDSLPAGNCVRVSSEESNFQFCKTDSWRKDSSLQFSPRTNSSIASYEECQREKGLTGSLKKSEAQHTMEKAMSDSMEQEGSKDVWIYACASFVRARLLLQLMQLNQSSFALESNLKAQQEIEDKLASFRLKEEVLVLITEAMGEDLVPEKFKEDTQGEVKCLSAPTLASIMTANAAEFERKWFQKLRDHLSHLDCQT